MSILSPTMDHFADYWPVYLTVTQYIDKCKLGNKLG